MGTCEQCHVSIGWFSGSKVKLPDGRTVKVCDSCAELLASQASMRGTAQRPGDTSRFSRLPGNPPLPEDERRTGAPATGHVVAPVPATKEGTLDLDDLFRDGPPEGAVRETRQVSPDGRTVVTVHTATRTTTTTGVEAAESVREMLGRVDLPPEARAAVLNALSQLGSHGPGGRVIETTPVSDQPDPDMPETSVQARIIETCIERFRAETGIDLRGDPMAMDRLGRVSARAAVEVVQAGSTEINLPFIFADANGPRHLLVRLGIDDVN